MRIFSDLGRLRVQISLIGIRERMRSMVTYKAADTLATTVEHT
jgi:hypothetical protein